VAPFDPTREYVNLFHPPEDKEILLIERVRRLQSQIRYFSHLLHRTKNEEIRAELEERIDRLKQRIEEIKEGPKHI
jgi:hypothetical protein